MSHRSINLYTILCNYVYIFPCFSIHDHIFPNVLQIFINHHIFPINLLHISICIYIYNYIHIYIYTYIRFLLSELTKSSASPWQVRAWVVAGLPNDSFSIENGIIMDKAVIRNWKCGSSYQFMDSLWIVYGYNMFSIFYG